MQLQAGTVMGGLTLSNSAWIPRCGGDVRVGRRAAKRSKTSSGAAQSRPRTKTRRFLFIGRAFGVGRGVRLSLAHEAIALWWAVPGARAGSRPIGPRPL